MQASIFIARLLGPLLLLPGIGMLFNPSIFRTVAVEVTRSLTLVYLFGLLDFAAGLAIVLTHNVWEASWRVLITLIGWVMLLRGAARIVVPDIIMPHAAKYIAKDRTYPVTGAAAVVLGIVLCYFGFMVRD